MAIVADAIAIVSERADAAAGGVSWLIGAVWPRLAALAQDKWLVRVAFDPRDCLDPRQRRRRKPMRAGTCAVAFRASGKAYIAHGLCLLELPDHQTLDTSSRPTPRSSLVDSRPATALSNSSSSSCSPYNHRLPITPRRHADGPGPGARAGAAWCGAAAAGCPRRHTHRSGPSGDQQLM